LPDDVTQDTRRVASTHYDYGIRLFEEPSVLGTSLLDCMDMMYPLDFAKSFREAFASEAYDVCSAHGFVYEEATESWRGDAAPPSANNVATRSVLRDIPDEFGRVLAIVHQRDRYRSDDDICVDTTY